MKKSDFCCVIVQYRFFSFDSFQSSTVQKIEPSFACKVVGDLVDDQTTHTAKRTITPPSAHETVVGPSELLMRARWGESCETSVGRIFKETDRHMR